MDTEIWNSQLEDKLIDMWEEQECLYKVSANSYRDRDKKKKAVDEIAAALGVSGMLHANLFICQLENMTF